MAQQETFEVSQGDITKQIDVPNPNGLSRAELMPLAAEAFGAYLKQNAAKPPAAPEDRSLSSGLQYGAAQAVTGLGKTGALLADKAVNSGIEPVAKAGRWFQENAPNIQGSIPEPKNYKPGGEELAQNIRDGNWSDAPGNLLRAGVESVAPGAAIIAGSAVGGLPGALATSAGLTLGPNVEAAGGDMLRGGAASAVQAPLDAFGVRGFGSAISKLPTAAVRAGARAVREGVGQAGGEAAKEVILTGEIDPANVAAAGLAGGVSRGILEGPGLVGDGVKAAGQGIRAGSENLMSRYGVEQPKTEAEARSYQIAADHIMEAKRLDAANGGNATDTQVANSALTTLRAQALETLRSLRDGGAIERTEFNEIRAGLDNAGKHNSTHLGDADPSFEVINRSSGLDASSKQSLKDLISGIQTLSGSSLQKRTVGPLESAGGTLGSAGSLVGGIAHGSPYTIAAALGGHTLAGKVVGMGGRMLDKALGLSKPAVLYKAQAADRLYGTYDGPSLGDHVENLRTDLRDPTSSLFEQIRSSRRAGGGPEVFDPADTAGATPSQPGRWADTMEQAKTEDLARTTAKQTAEKVTADAEARALKDKAEADKRATAALPRPLTPNEQRAYDIADARAGLRQATAAKRNAEAATKRASEEAANSAVADMAEREKSTRAADRAATEKQTVLAKAQALEANAKAKREADTTKAEKAKATQEGLTKRQQEDSAWAAHRAPLPGPDATASQVAGYLTETKALAKAKAAAAKGAPFDPATSPRTTPAEGPAYDHMRRDAEALNKGTEGPPVPDELGNLPDPVPVNTPIKGKGLKAAQAILADHQAPPKIKPNTPDALDVIEQLKDAKGAPGKPHQAPDAPAGDTPTGDPAKGPPASPESRPVGYGEAADTHVLSHGPLAYASISLNGREAGILGNGRANAADVKVAVNHMLENGTLGRMVGDPSLAPELAHALVNGHVPESHPMSKLLGQAIILQVAKNKGVLDDVAYQRPTGDAPRTMSDTLRAAGGAAPRLDAEGKPIRSIDAYNNAAAAYREQIAQQIKTAQEMNFPKLATALDKISRVPGLMEKSRIREPYITALREAAKRGTAGAKVELTHALTALDYKGMAMKGKLPKETP